MSSQISGTTISLTRGDTLFLTIKLTKDGKPYTPQDGDKIRFALKKKYTDDEVLILKQIPIDSMTLRIDPEDTKNLNFGTYVYDVELTTKDGFVDTFITPSSFKITEEVY